MEVKSTPTIESKITISLPAMMVLPVNTDESGFIVPATGVMWQKYLNYDTLLALGVSIEWHNPDGTILRSDEAVAYIEAAMARSIQAQATTEPRAVLKA
jgi:hypothetical protein